MFKQISGAWRGNKGGVLRSIRARPHRCRRRRRRQEHARAFLRACLPAGRVSGSADQGGTLSLSLLLSLSFRISEEICKT